MFKPHDRSRSRDGQGTCHASRCCCGVAVLPWPRFPAPAERSPAMPPFSYEHVLLTTLSPSTNLQPAYPNGHPIYFGAFFRRPRGLETRAPWPVSALAQLQLRDVYAELGHPRRDLRRTDQPGRRVDQPVPGRRRPQRHEPKLQRSKCLRPSTRRRPRRGPRRTSRSKLPKLHLRGEQPPIEEESPAH